MESTTMTSIMRTVTTTQISTSRTQETTTIPEVITTTTTTTTIPEVITTTTTTRTPSTSTTITPCKSTTTRMISKRARKSSMCHDFNLYGQVKRVRSLLNYSGWCYYRLNYV
ncbi:hypothetical protein POPTR_004G048301v4 [Populus trichocarpa]|uniref:Uncharacterized protein n=1 Tax=Populus trichocarpa TaxID=3694 RepID=A0ACC0T3L7_POPTR|nr:hypothetical protein BDE02_04G041400 [Populus trichocarpa]KAI9395923.1 hypothetical protein POPTR_004G048301v4 [Populus trichocarpa]